MIGCLGAALRVWVYLQGRGYWLDEGSLLGNIQGKSPFDFSTPLTSDQLAPPGFLAAERVVVRLLGASPYATRLIPLACGLSALALFGAIAGLILAPAAAIVAMALFAFNDDLVYYSNELKPYSTDLAVGLVVTLLSLREVREGPSRRRLLGIAFLAAASPWFSFPSAFVVAGCGLTLLVHWLGTRRWNEAGALVAIAAAWAASVFLAYRMSSRLLAPSTSMYVFWDFAFLPFPPKTGGDLAKAAGILLETFVTPLNLVPRMLPYAFAAFALLMTIRGARSLGRRDVATLAILVAPLFVALAASAIRRYPFHGRLILWLAPALFLLIAEGVRLVRFRRGAAWYAFVLAFLMTYPVLSTLYEAVPPHYRDFNRHGDLRRNQFME